MQAAADPIPAETERVVVARSGGPGVLEVRRAPIAPPGPGEVLLRVRAAGLNFADIFAREGLYGPAPRPESLCLGLFVDLEGPDAFPEGGAARPGTVWRRPSSDTLPRSVGVGLAH